MSIQFGIFFQGVNYSTVWNAPESGSQTEFESFRRVIQTAERGLFTAFFLGEGLRLREHLGHLHDLDVAGRPDGLTQLAALAAITEHIGLVATQNTTYNDPVDLAHRLQSLDVISGGRAAWNVVTTDNAWTGANFRRGGYLDHADRYRQAGDAIDIARKVWDARALAGPTAEIAPDRRADRWGAAPAPFHHELRHYDVDAAGSLPGSPQQHPILFQAGDSPDGRDFAAKYAEVVFSAHGTFDDAKEFAADIRARTVAAGRPADDLKIFPGQEFIVADTLGEVDDKVRWVREHQITPQTAVAFVEALWGTDLSDHDPDGPLPTFDPVQHETGETRGAGFRAQKALDTANQWRALSESKRLSIRELVIEIGTRRGFAGTADSIADELVPFSREHVVDGFNITPWLVPSGLDDIVDKLVPALQERGVYWTEYPADTLRENLGLRPPLTRRGDVPATGGADVTARVETPARV
ncbi:F420-dependent methylene-tetrahydromethanopterin reductase [Frondihabitans sp. PAMC 28766]|uniref:NtaA/DmoA family FMN-dependent monooxygenase n=1 Tax=Frondihabitans sp. PAMC 28766 TaxID=1795630 RepID=UPI00078B4DCC|nr:NtaA/DmoA family FMN-dependent monooxygenase [Frondihabitans sp. PAMC 28766]AMM21388.1 F420-dependent methylene-tetrahydromethanopterin reductase [Frondihabitans sp. PAMC 28766]